MSLVKFPNVTLEGTSPGEWRKTLKVSADNKHIQIEESDHRVRVEGSVVMPCHLTYDTNETMRDGGYKVRFTHREEACESVVTSVQCMRQKWVEVEKKAKGECQHLHLLGKNSTFFVEKKTYSSNETVQIIHFKAYNSELYLDIRTRTPEPITLELYRTPTMLEIVGNCKSMTINVSRLSKTIENRMMSECTDCKYTFLCRPGQTVDVSRDDVSWARFVTLKTIPKPAEKEMEDYVKPSYPNAKPKSKSKTKSKPKSKTKAAGKPKPKPRTNPKPTPTPKPKSAPVLSVLSLPPLPEPKPAPKPRPTSSPPPVPSFAREDTPESEEEDSLTGDRIPYLGESLLMNCFNCLRALPNGRCDPCGHLICMGCGLERKRKRERCIQIGCSMPIQDVQRVYFNLAPIKTKPRAEVDCTTVKRAKVESPQPGDTDTSHSTNSSLQNGGEVMAPILQSAEINCIDLCD